MACCKVSEMAIINFSRHYHRTKLTDQPFGKISQTFSSETKLLMSLSMLSATPGYYNINTKLKCDKNLRSH